LVSRTVSSMWSSSPQTLSFQSTLALSRSPSASISLNRAITALLSTAPSRSASLVSLLCRATSSFHTLTCWAISSGDPVEGFSAGSSGTGSPVISATSRLNSSSSLRFFAWSRIIFTISLTKNRNVATPATSQDHT